MIKLSAAIRKNEDGKLELLYIGEDATEANKTYRSASGEVYLFDRCRPERQKRVREFVTSESPPKEADDSLETASPVKRGRPAKS